MLVLHHPPSNYGCIVLCRLNVIQNAAEPNANEIAMLLSNLAKSDQILKILALKRAVPKPLSRSEYAIDQLMDCFVKGAGGAYNKHADYDYLSYLFADLAKVGYYHVPRLHNIGTLNGRAV